VAVPVGFLALDQVDLADRDRLLVLAVLLQGTVGLLDDRARLPGVGVDVEQ
jgi:hypothetical protein